MLRRFISRRNHIFFTKKHVFWDPTFSAFSSCQPIHKLQNMKTDLVYGAKLCLEHYEKSHYAFISARSNTIKSKKWALLRFLKMLTFIEWVRKKWGVFQCCHFKLFLNLACSGRFGCSKKHTFFFKKHRFFSDPPTFSSCDLGPKRWGGVACHLPCNKFLLHCISSTDQHRVA